MANSGDRIDDISTHWKTLLEAFVTPPAPEEVERMVAARERFFRRYESVSRAYLGVLLEGTPNRDEAIEECFQALAERFCRGLRKLEPKADSSFGKYLKQALRNAANDYRRKSRRAGQELPEDLPAADSAESKVFEEGIRLAYLGRGHELLVESDARDGTRHARVLELDRQFPNDPGGLLAAHEAAFGPTKPATVRTRRHNARAALAYWVAEAVRFDTTRPGREALDDELRDLGLLDSIKSIVTRSRTENNLEVPSLAALIRP